ncbi:hypothetical protein AMECASPLE_019804 [Ameca splendens]|uniref:Uncharacterized protein n=1 Tax=Ameca splendens TaxID=208324 RepID=A0ABV0Y342_9TELE
MANADIMFRNALLTCWNAKSSQTHTQTLVFSISPPLAAKTAGSHVTVKGLYFLLPVIIIDGLLLIPLRPPTPTALTGNHRAHTHVCPDLNPNGLLQLPSFPRQPQE